MLKFYLDNILVSDPINWADFTETFEHDDNIKGILPKYEMKLKFTGKGNDHLYKKYLAEGYCSHSKLKVLSKCSQSDPYTTDFEGIIFLKDCRFNTNKCETECEVEDNNYGARIHNNKSIKVYVDSTKTKNNVSLTPALHHFTAFFRSVDGVYIVGFPRKTYPIYDCFRFIIEFITDKLVGFESNYLQQGEVSQIDITTGGLIRKPDDIVLPPEVPFISFEMLFKEVAKKFPIAFTVVDRGGKPTIKIENEDFFYTNNASGAVLSNIDDLVQYFNNEVLYSSVRFGGPSVPVDYSIHHFVYDKFRSFKEEEYYFTGECNIDKVLDLKGDWIADSNIIEELFMIHTNDSYDTNIFFIQQSFQNAKQQPNPLTLSDPFYYNPALTNDRVAARFKSIELVLQDSVLSFRAALSQEQPSGALYDPPSIGAPAIVSPRYQVKFDDDSTFPNYDTSATYNTSLWRFTAPQLGEYTFQSGMSFIKDSPNNPVDSSQKVDVHMVFSRYSSVGVLITETDNYVGTFLFDGNFPIQSTATFQLNVGDYVIVSYYHIRSRYSPVSPLSFVVVIGHGSWFRNISSPTAAVRPSSGTNRPYLASTLQFEYPISNQQWALIKSDISRSIVINNGDGRNRECWIRKISRNKTTSMANCELITDINYI